MPILVECSVYQSSIFLKCNPHALACSEDSDIAAFCTAVHMLSSVAGIYMELGQDLTVSCFFFVYIGLHPYPNYHGHLFRCLATKGDDTPLM
jgi:hypothetical protein